MSSESGGRFSGAQSLIDEGITVASIIGNPSVIPEAIELLKSEDGMGRGIRIIANSLADRLANGREQVLPTIPGLRIHRFWNPWPHWDDENNLSLVVHMSIHGINFLFTGDIEKKGFENILELESIRRFAPSIDVLFAPHHGRENGKCPMLFDELGCNPFLVLISDCAKKHQTQETVPFYATKAKGISDFRSYDGKRYVLTTRSDGAFYFTFQSGRCYVS